MTGRWRGGQLRFGNTLDGFARLLEGAEAAVAGAGPDARTGVAVHSLRAVGVEALTEATALRPEAPFHIHIAEQVAEVNDILGTHGATPVKWLLEIMDVGPRWCLIHATHMTPAETEGLARSGAVAGLCPITESNLGDGIFNGAAYLPRLEGVFGVSDRIRMCGSRWPRNCARWNIRNGWSTGRGLSWRWGRGRPGGFSTRRHSRVERRPWAAMPERSGRGAGRISWRWIPRTCILRG